MGWFRIGITKSGLENFWMVVPGLPHEWCLVTNSPDANCLSLYPTKNVIQIQLMFTLLGFSNNLMSPSSWTVGMEASRTTNFPQAIFQVPNLGVHLCKAQGPLQCYIRRCQNLQQTNPDIHILKMHSVLGWHLVFIGKRLHFLHWMLEVLDLEFHTLQKQSVRFQVVINNCDDRIGYAEPPQ